MIANAGEVNAGDFDPLAEIAELTEANDAWLHVDGAFGLFARLAPESRGLTAGIERADSVTVDCHKWLNVPYDCGVAFVREPARLARALNFGAPYLPRPDDPRPNFGFIAPESSRRSRALNVWATLRAYGRSGYREMVERHLALARGLGERVDREPDFERLADVKPEHRLLSRPPRGRGRGRPRRAQPAARRAPDRRRQSVLGHDRLRREGRLPAGDRQLADHRGRRPDADRRAAELLEEER